MPIARTWIVAYRTLMSVWDMSPTCRFARPAVASQNSALAGTLRVVSAATAVRFDDRIAMDGGAVGILTDEMKRCVDAQLGFIATVCSDGTPNLSPKGTTAVWDDDHLVFAHVHSQGTVANLETNPSCEINVVDQLIRKGYRFKGTAELHTSGELFERGLMFYEARGTIRPRERIKAIVIIAVERALQVTSPAYDLGTTEAEQRDLWLGRLITGST